MPSNCLTARILNHINYIYAAFPQNRFSKCPFKLPACKDAWSYWLHLFTPIYQLCATGDLFCFSAQHKKIKTITLNTFERYCYREQLAQLKQFKQQYATHTIQCNLKCNLIQFRQELFMLSFTTRDLCRHRNFLLFCTQPTPHSCPGSQLEYQSNHETNNHTIYFRPEKAHCQLLY